MERSGGFHEQPDGVVAGRRGVRFNVQGACPRFARGTARSFRVVPARASFPPGRGKQRPGRARSPFSTSVHGLNGFDTRRGTFSLIGMAVLLKTSVEDRVAERFNQAAKLHGKTPGAYLQQIVEHALLAHQSPTNGDHRKRSVRSKQTRLAYDLMSRLRTDEDE